VKQATATKHEQPPPAELTSDQLASVSGGGRGRWVKHPRPRNPRGNRPK
jgi:hypothetical protein